MPRPIWSGSISFGLINIPIKLFSATSPKDVRFHQLHEKDGVRIQQKRVCPADGQEVPYDEIVKGYERSRDHYVIITDEELQSLDPKASRTIDIDDFVELAEIDPIFYEHTYYLAPDKGADKAYGLLHAAMKDTGKVAVGKFVLRTKEYLCTIRPMENVLCASTMLYADEVVDAEEIPGLPEREKKPAERELTMAKQLIDSLVTEFEPERYKDEYRERVLDLIERKAEGQEIVRPPMPEEPGKVIDLMAALEASLAAAKDKGGAKEEGLGAKKRAPKQSRAEEEEEEAPHRKRKKAA